jgi:hypothetical protein
VQHADEDYRIGDGVLTTRQSGALARPYLLWFDTTLCRSGEVMSGYYKLITDVICVSCTKEAAGYSGCFLEMHRDAAFIT